jgi:uncharacterized membrane protein
MGGQATEATRGTVPAALVPDGRRFDPARRGERFSNNFWLIPAAFLLGALLLAVATRRIDESLGPVTRSTPPWIVSASGAGTVLSTLATAMLTFLGVVFSIGLVALQLASQQFSPRVLRNYVRTQTTKVALGTFIATFIYPLFSLGYLDELARGGHPDRATVAVAVAMVLAVASITVFIAYVTLTIRGMRIAYAISTVAVETRRALDQVFPAAGLTVAVAPPHACAPDRVVPYRSDRRALGIHLGQGMLQALDIPACVRLAREHDCLVRLTPQIGQYVGSGEALFELYAGAGGPASLPSDADLLRTVDIGPERAVYRDPFYGVRALVDVAAQALSPAVNAPTTAVQVLDRLQDFLRELAPRPWQNGLYADRDGRLRLVVAMRSWDQFVDLALTEITEFGGGSPQVTRRIASLLAALKEIVPDERRAVLVRHETMLAEAVAQRVASYRVLTEVALEPDARGLG